ncbi:MAG: twin-arginine translocase subunit TatC [Desulfobulbus sp.]|nr:twin-arginine translocase subunit TatC [Desulfobulbus sp.]
MIEALEQFRPHHQELKERLIRCFIAIAVTTTIAYLFKENLAAWSIHPLYQAYPQLDKLVYTKLTEAFLSYLKLALLVGLIGALPFILYQLWLFVAPGLLDQEKKTVRTILAWATTLFAGGTLFAYFVALPRILHFFMSYAGPSLQPRLKLGLYLTFTARMLLTFGIAFEIPFLMVMANRTGLIKDRYFQNKRIYFYIAIVVLAFLLTTGEVTATVLLSFPLFALYEAGIIACRVFNKADAETGDSTAP